MMRDYARVIDALETKAADRAVTDAERDALMAKANELRVAYGVAPPMKPPTTPRTATSSPEPWRFWATTTSTNNMSATFTTFVRTG